MGVHSRFAPSSASRRVHCPGSAELEPQYQDTTSPAAERGTFGHEIAAAILTNQTPPATDDFELLDAVNVYVDAVQAVGIGQVEQRLEMPQVHPDAFGTCDHWTIQGNTIYVDDLKLGWGVVEPVENWQLIQYFAGVVINRIGNDTGYEACLRIIQPFPWHPLGSVREWRLPATDLRAYINQLANAYSDTSRTAAGSHCKWCRARADCHTLRQSGLSLVDNIADRPVALSLPTDELDREYSLIRQAIEVLSARATGIEETIKAAGGSQNWTVDRSPGRLYWNEPVAKIIEYGKLLGIDVEKTDVITPTQAAKKGFPIDGFATRKAGAEKLVPAENSLAKRLFDVKTG